MALKRALSEKERYGLTQHQIDIAEKYLRKHKTAGAIAITPAMKVYELFMIGSSFQELDQQFDQYDIAQIILTAAIRGWCVDRDKMMHTLRDRVRAKVVKSVIDQVDFLTTMLQCVNAQHMNDMRKYILDPENNVPPTITIKNIKEYKEVSETLYKIVQGATPGAKGKTSPMFDALAPDVPESKKKTLPEDEEEEFDPTQFLAENSDVTE